MTANEWNMQRARNNDAEAYPDYMNYLTPAQSNAFHAVVTSLLVDTRKGILPRDKAEFALQLMVQKDMLTPLDRASLIRMAEFCIHGIMLLNQKKRQSAEGEGI